MLRKRYCDEYERKAMRRTTPGIARRASQTLSYFDMLSKIQKRESCWRRLIRDETVPRHNSSSGVRPRCVFLRCNACLCYSFRDSWNRSVRVYCMCIDSNTSLHGSSYTSPIQRNESSKSRMSSHVNMLQSSMFRLSLVLNQSSPSGS